MLSKQIPKNGNYNQYLGPQVKNSMYLNNVTKLELTKVINLPASKKSSGPDNISVNIIQKCQELYDTFLHVVKLSFSTGVVPEDMKIAKVIAIHKKGEKYLLGYYQGQGNTGDVSDIHEVDHST